MKYSVVYGVNNSHMTEAELFDLYRDAKKFFNELEAKFESKICQKLSFDNNGIVSKKVPKLFKFESGTDNTLMLKSLALPQI